MADKPRPLDLNVDPIDYSNYPGEEGLMTPDQYNGTLEYEKTTGVYSSYLQMNSVPRLDSPRNMPLRSPLDDSRRPYSQRMLTNGSQNSLQSVLQGV